MFSFLLKLLLWSVGILIIVFYPLLVSKYVFIPLLIGVAGYLFIVGIEQNKIMYILPSLFYFTNLEVNLSLPLFLMVVASLITYLIFVKNMIPLKRCKACRAVYIALMVDVSYFLLLISYDFIFQTSSVVVDTILLYSLFFDLLAVMIL